MLKNAVVVNQTLECITPIWSEPNIINHLGVLYGACFTSDTSDYEKNKRRVLTSIKKGHQSPLEHIFIGLKIVVDRATAYALIRHRHCAFTQQSTIYTKFKEVQVIELPAKDPYYTGYKYSSLDERAIDTAAEEYTAMIESGVRPGIARDVLPNCLATTLYMTTNLRQWFYILNLRKDPADSPRMHMFISQLDAFLKGNYPILYEALTKDLYVKA